MGKCFGPGFPRPENTDITDVDRIVRWVLEKKRSAKRCCITTTASNAARIARTAWEMRASLGDAIFIVSGEPFTEAKRETIERVGARGTSRYTYGGGVMVGYGCANRVFTDEVHIDEPRLALINHPLPLTDHGPPIHPLLLTTVYPSATTRLLFNVANGDYGTLVERECGCALGKAGLTLHLHHIRSHEKLTSEGMNYFYGDLYEFFEKTLPFEFGGGPGDYQLVEEEEERGQTRLTLRVHPNVGEIDQQKLLSRLRDGIARNSWSKEFQTRVWERAGTLRVRREAPYASSRGKILPLHISR
jgi:phenylacetate-coenzyme A ligase PaaK-like adenylate-forming protein